MSKKILAFALTSLLSMLPILLPPRMISSMVSSIMPVLVDAQAPSSLSKSLLGLLFSRRFSASAFGMTPLVFGSSINFFQCKMRVAVLNSASVVFAVPIGYLNSFCPKKGEVPSVPQVAQNIYYLLQRQNPSLKLMQNGKKMPQRQS